MKGWSKYALHSIADDLDQLDGGLSPRAKQVGFIRGAGAGVCFHVLTYTELEPKIRPLLVGWDEHRVKREHGDYVFFTTGSREEMRKLRAKLDMWMAALRRKDRERSAAGFHLPEHYRILWNIQSGRCYFSGVPLGARFEDRAFSIDHLRPLAARQPPFGDGIAGTQWPTNLALVTVHVNKSKGANTAEQYVALASSLRIKLRPARERLEIDRARDEAFQEFIEKNRGNASPQSNGLDSQQRSGRGRIRSQRGDA